jgi:ABC-type dipeptide/oligopeptide/nickel transport system permease component
MALSTGKFVLGRVASVMIVIVGVTGLTWLSVNALRPDLRAGDDRFILVAFADFLQSAFLHFDFGVSRTGGNREVQDLIRQGLPADLSLLAGGLTVGLIAGIAGGAVCAARPRTFLARALETVAVLFMCAPVYVVALMLLLLFGAGLGLVVESGIAIPVFSLTGVTMPIVVTNLVLIEQVFSIPGVFTGMRRGIAAGDFDLLFGLTAVAAGLVAVSSLATDVVLAWLDPRVRAGA